MVVMHTPANTGAGGTQSPHAPRDVVAGLVNDGMAPLVAGAAVREAVHRAARVRFVQVLPVGLSSEERAEMDVAMFGVALRALHRQRRVPCTFETVDGEAAQTLVERSHGAAVLVVGRDAPNALLRVGQYCQEHAECDVLTVSGPEDMQLASPGRAGSAYSVLASDRVQDDSHRSDTP